MSTDKPLADVQPGGRVRLSDVLPEDVAQALATVNEVANDARHAGNYRVANALVHARVALSKQLLALSARQPAAAVPQGCDACHRTGIRRNDEGRNVFCPDCDLGAAYAGDAAQPSPGGQRDDSPMAKMAAALRGKAEAERAAFDQRVQSGEWGPMPDNPDVLALPPLPEEVDSVRCMIRGEKGFADPCDYYFTSKQMRDYARTALAARQPVGEPVEHDCANCDRRHAEVICPTCAGIAWDNGRLHEFYEVRELSTSLGEGVLDLLLPDEWHEKPLLRFQGAHDEGDDSVGISPRSANVLADDQTGTVLGDYLAARAAKEGGR